MELKWKIAQNGATVDRLERDGVEIVAMVKRQRDKTYAIATVKSFTPECLWAWKWDDRRFDSREEAQATAMAIYRLEA